MAFNAAAPESSLRFLFWGAIVVLPVVIGYAVYVYWVFRGKVHTGYGWSGAGAAGRRVTACA